MLINCVTPNPPLELVPSGHWPPLLRRQKSLSSTRGFKELKRLPAFRAARRIGRSESCGWVGRCHIYEYAEGLRAQAEVVETTEPPALV